MYNDMQDDGLGMTTDEPLDLNVGDEPTTITPDSANAPSEPAFSFSNDLADMYGHGDVRNAAATMTTPVDDDHGHSFEHHAKEYNASTASWLSSDEVQGTTEDVVENPSGRYTTNNSEPHTGSSNDGVIFQNKPNTGTKTGEPPDESGPEDANSDNSEEDDEATQEQWQAIVDHIRNKEPDSVSFTSLANYEQGLARRNIANERLEQVFQLVQEVLQKTVQKMLQIALPIFEATQARLEHQQEDLLNTMLSNHERRDKMLTTLEESHTRYEAKYRALVATILQEVSSNDSEGGDTNLYHQDTLLDGDDSDTDTGNARMIDAAARSKYSVLKTLNTNVNDSKASEKNGGSEEDQDDEPDWAKLMNSYAPTSKNVGRYLQGRERWHEAHSRLVSYMDALEKTLHDLIERILGVAQNVFYSLQEDLDGQQHDIQTYLHSNVVRRHELQTALEASAKEAQGIFASLMARVTSCMSASSSSKRTLESCAAAGQAPPQRKPKL